MSSKISGFDSGNRTPAVGAGRAVQRPQDAATGGPRGSGGNAGTNPDNVQITGAARQMSNLEQAIRELPAVDEARVAQISAAIAQGTYTINPRHIADQLMQMDKALGHLPDSQDGAESA